MCLKNQAPGTGQGDLKEPPIVLCEFAWGSSLYCLLIETNWNWYPEAGGLAK